jgi:hypothetical protein
MGQQRFDSAAFNTTMFWYSSFFLSNIFLKINTKGIPDKPSYNKITKLFSLKSIIRPLLYVFLTSLFYDAVPLVINSDLKSYSVETSWLSIS